MLTGWALWACFLPTTQPSLLPRPQPNQTSRDICCVVFAIFNVIWSTLFLEEWKRRGAEFAYKWGTLDTPAESIEEPRPQFRVSWGPGHSWSPGEGRAVGHTWLPKRPS